MLSKIHLTIENLKQLMLLNLKGCESLDSLPQGICFNFLETFILSGCTKLDRFLEIVGDTSHLSQRFLDRTAIKEMPTSAKRLSGLMLLDLRDCKNILSLLDFICSFISLENLNISGCSLIDQLPENIRSLEKLEKLDACRTALRKAPSSIVLLKNLKILCFTQCGGVADRSSSQCSSKSNFSFQLPESFSGLSSLTCLSLTECNLEEGAILEDIGCLTLLEHLELSRNNFMSLPNSISQLSNLRRFTLDNCRKLGSLLKLPLNVKHVQAHDSPMLKDKMTIRPSDKGFSFIDSRKSVKVEGCLTHHPLPMPEEHIATLFPKFIQDVRSSSLSCSFALPRAYGLSQRVPATALPDRSISFFKEELNHCWEVSAFFRTSNPDVEVAMCGIIVVYEQDLGDLNEMISECALGDPDDEHHRRLCYQAYRKAVEGFLSAIESGEPEIIKEEIYKNPEKVSEFERSIDVNELEFDPSSRNQVLGTLHHTKQLGIDLKALLSRIFFEGSLYTRNLPIPFSFPVTGFATGPAYQMWQSKGVGSEQYMRKIWEMKDESLQANMFVLSAQNVDKEVSTVNEQITIPCDPIVVHFKREFMESSCKLFEERSSEDPKLGLIHLQIMAETPLFENDLTRWKRNLEDILELHVRFYVFITLSLKGHIISVLKPFNLFSTYNLCFPRKEILKWFGDYRVSERTVGIGLPQNLKTDKDWRGIAICVGFSVQEHPNAFLDDEYLHVSFRLLCHLSTDQECCLNSAPMFRITKDKFKWSYICGFIWLTYISSSLLLAELRGQSHIAIDIYNECPGLVTKNLSVHLLFKEDVEDFRQSITKCMTFFDNLNPIYQFMANESDKKTTHMLIITREASAVLK
ncbi:hypothetical protein FEM48_Zijuj10G0167600 [Ziziphus jujuba var. spinosa]|uniref:Disease resistance-like protein DSC1 n=1 Tax=Ziziphus jujuba var. spinosa TaxID=714518 RepID=A0A978UPJ4_ZIZJJ|nr:hypothetical protein FEM48_Zijuj10G0167600 [Ziziphus jujuba var. spinosa]